MEQFKNETITRLKFKEYRTNAKLKFKEYRTNAKLTQKQLSVLFKNKLTAT